MPLPQGTAGSSSQPRMISALWEGATEEGFGPAEDVRAVGRRRVGILIAKGSDFDVFLYFSN